MLDTLAGTWQVSALTWGVCGAIAVVCLALAIAWRRLHGSHGLLSERNSRPEALPGAELVYVEKRFRISEPVGLIAKVDRAYRMPSGLIVLVELKTRWMNRPFLSDVIQMSAQRTAMIGETRHAVAPYAYVMVYDDMHLAPMILSMADHPSAGRNPAALARWRVILPFFAVFHLLPLVLMGGIAAPFPFPDSSSPSSAIAGLIAHISAAAQSIPILGSPMVRSSWFDGKWGTGPPGIVRRAVQLLDILVLSRDGRRRELLQDRSQRDWRLALGQVSKRFAFQA